MGSVKGTIKEGAGFVKEETGEMLGDRKMANEGRNLRNEGKIEQGKAPKITPPGYKSDVEWDDEKDNNSAS